MCFLFVKYPTTSVFRLRGVHFSLLMCYDYACERKWYKISAHERVNPKSQQITITLHWLWSNLVSSIHQGVFARQNPAFDLKRVISGVHTNAECCGCHDAYQAPGCPQSTFAPVHTKHTKSYFVQETFFFKFGISIIYSFVWFFKSPISVKYGDIKADFTELLIEYLFQKRHLSHLSLKLVRKLNLSTFYPNFRWGANVLT